VELPARAEAGEEASAGVQIDGSAGPAVQNAQPRSRTEQISPWAEAENIIRERIREFTLAARAPEVSRANPGLLTGGSHDQTVYHGS